MSGPGTKDMKATVTTKTGREVTMQLVFLEYNERLLLLREGRGYRAAIPVPLCSHKSGHKRMEDAALCGLKVAQEIAESERLNMEEK